MFNIPATYYKNNEDYITIPKIKDFMRSHPEGKFKLSQSRQALMDSIIEFGRKNDENAETVLSWLDEALQEGIKDIRIQSYTINEALLLKIHNINSANAYIKQFVTNGMLPHICLNNYSSDFALLNTEAKNSKFGIKLVFVFCKKLHMHDKKNQMTRIIDYPVIAEYYINGEWLLVKAKPRSNLYVYNPNGFVLEEAKTTTTDKQIKEVIEQVKEILAFENKDSKSTSAFLKNKVFKLLHQYTKTPSEILNVMETNNELISDISDRIEQICDVNGCCQIPISMKDDVKKDIDNIVEKYLSINWNSKEIFIKDRDAYPIKLSATDEEESKVEQTAALREPLQTKALFFDNKKMLYKNKKCDGVVFQWKRINTLQTLNSYFPVKIFVDEKGNGTFKFQEYTTKEDIENVIFSVIMSTQSS